MIFVMYNQLKYSLMFFFSQKGDDGFVYLNKPSKSIEFWLPFKGEILMATIHAMNIGWIQIDE